MATSLVRSLFTGSEDADAMLLEDTVDHNARPLLKCFVHHLTNRFSAVHLFLFDVDSHHWLSGLPQEVTEKITVHDGFSDPLGWDTNKTPSPLIHLNNCSAQSLIDRLGDKPLRDDRAVVIDSLSPLLLHQSPAVVCRMIHAVGGHCSMMVCLVHADLHQDHVLLLVKVVYLDCALSPIKENREKCLEKLVVDPFTAFPEEFPYPYVTTITNFAVVFDDPVPILSFQMEHYTISHSFSALSTTDYHGSPPLASDSHEMTSEPDPAANLTFDLRLSSKEKEERSKVILPYTAVRDGGVGVASGSTGHAPGGQIYYQPDDVDDFDESDPDDDLDI